MGEKKKKNLKEVISCVLIDLLVLDDAAVLSLSTVFKLQLVHVQWMFASQARGDLLS